MKKRLILLVDFSEYSDALIKYASDWAGQINAELLLVHQSSVITPAMTDYEARHHILRESNSEALQRLKSLAKELVPTSIKISFHASEKHLSNSLNQFLTEPFDNLVFAGIKGTGLLKRIFLGSTVLDVIDKTEEVVIAMPKGIEKFSPERIFVAVTKKYPLNVPALDKVLSFKGHHNPRLTFFHLTKPHKQPKDIENYLSELANAFEDRYKTDFIIYKGDHPFEDIKKVVNNKINEALIVQKGSRLLTDQLFRRFLINELVYEGETPLVVLP